MRSLVRFYDTGALISFSVMMACVLLEVVARNIIHMPTTWAEGLSRFMCVWAVFLGSASAVYRGSHIVVNVLPRRLSGVPRKTLDLIGATLTGIFLVAVWIGSGIIMYVQWEAQVTSLQISIGWFYLGLFIGATGMVVFHAQALWRLIVEPPQTKAA